MEFSRQEYWSGLPFLSPGDLPDPGIEPRSPALKANALPFEPPDTLLYWPFKFPKLKNISIWLRGPIHQSKKPHQQEKNYIETLKEKQNFWNHCLVIRYMFMKSTLNFPGGSVIKNLPTKQETQVQSLSWEDPLEKEMATHSSILDWEIPWTDKPGGLQSWSHQGLDVT